MSVNTAALPAIVEDVRGDNNWMSMVSICVYTNMVPLPVFKNIFVPKSVLTSLFSHQLISLTAFEKCKVFDIL